MKKVRANSKNNLSNKSGPEFSSAAFRKRRKKRILPDAFYPRWELEILSSAILIFLLWVLPDWIRDTNNLLASNYEVEINTKWINVACNVALVGFTISMILRAIWLTLVWKWHNDSQNRGDQMFRNDTGQEMRTQFRQKQNLAIVLDEAAEIVFFISSAILFVTVFGYLLHVLGALLNHAIHKIPKIPGAK